MSSFGWAPCDWMSNTFILYSWLSIFNHKCVWNNSFYKKFRTLKIEFKLNCFEKKSFFWLNMPFEIRWDSISKYSMSENWWFWHSNCILVQFFITFFSYYLIIYKRMFQWIKFKSTNARRTLLRYMSSVAWSIKKLVAALVKTI